MDTAPLRVFAVWARAALLREVGARVAAVLAPGSSERVELPGAVAALERAVGAAGGGDVGRSVVVDRVAYTWFNRVVALRFMDANGYTGVGVVSPQAGAGVGQPEVLADAKRGVFDGDVVGGATRSAVMALLDGTRASGDPQGEAYALLLAEYCRHWNRVMPFMFQQEGDFTELLVPSNLLADDSVVARSVEVLTAEVCADVEVIGWLYQFYISERKDEVFAGFKKNKKAGAAEIPAATQLFTPHWIVRYLVENSLGRLWMLNRPGSALVEQMDYYVAPVDEETDFLEVDGPEDLKVLDPACGSGHMLTYAFDLLYAIYEEEGYSPSEIPGLVLANNLFGTEIDQRAGSLAAFALTMKARAKQRTFFNRQVAPNICVVGPVSFTVDELDVLAGDDGDPVRDGHFWNQFEHADLLGSLVQPDPAETQRLARHLDSLDDGGNILAVDVLDRARKVVDQAEYLLPRYAVVVANPPYMGTRNMTAKLAAWLATAYPRFKSDLFAAFVWRCHELARPAGRVGLMTPNVWMYISSHREMRATLCSSGKLESLLELPLSGFKGATVQICAYTFATTGRVGRQASFLMLTGLGGDADFGSEAAAAIGRPDPDTVFIRRPADFAAVPGTPVAYWLDPAVSANYSTGRLLGDVAFPRKGMDTGENDEFLRMWWEVSRADLATSGESDRKWFPYNKGGGFRRWYGNREFVVNWELEGKAIRARLSWPSKKPTLRNQEFMKREGFTWGTISSGGFSARYSPAGALFDNGGCTLFADRDLDRIGAFLNSSTADLYLAFLAPTLNFQPGDVAKLPIPPGFDSADLESKRCVEIAKEDWDSREESFDFERLQLVRDNARLSEAVVEQLAAGQALVDELRSIEESNNRKIAAAYGLTGIAAEEVLPERVTLTCNPAHRLGPDGGTEGNGRMNRELIAEVISFAIGCMFGRYSLDVPGLVLADQGASLEDYLAKVPSPSFVPDGDNVIPFVDGDWFEDDVVGRFREFLRVAFGEEHFEENLQFVTESLGVRTLRDYFVKSFYKDHVQRYKKRPIYWMFSSPKGSFNALVYLHRYTPSTVSTVLNEYLREFQGKLRAALEHAERSNDSKEADRLRKVLVELDEYEHDTLYPLASQNLAIDLDDGVKVNYPKFGGALKKIPGLEATE